MKVSKPKVLMYLESCKFNFSYVENTLDNLGVKLVDAKTLEEIYPQLHKSRFSQIDPANGSLKASQGGLDFNAAPARGCINCRTEIKGKANQCSACKSVIYCSPHKIRPVRR